MDYVKTLYDKLNSFKRQSSRTVFLDFIEIAAIISQKVALSVLCYSEDKLEELEQRYLEIIKKYSKCEIEQITEIFSIFLVAVNEYFEKGIFKDILGELYQKLNMCNQKLGQVLTPEHVSHMMAEMMLPEDNFEVDSRKVFRIADPCCGTGRMSLQAAQVLLKRNPKIYGRTLFVSGDIDPAMAMITYVQLSYYGCSAFVFCGNTLTMEFNAEWITIGYAMQWCKFQDHNTNNCFERCEATVNDVVQGSLFEEVLL